MAINKRIYSRTIAVRRPISTNTTLTPQVGMVGYSGLGVTQDATGEGGETVLFTNVACSVQARAMGKTTAGRGFTPSDSPGPPAWYIYIPLGLVAKGAIRDGDVAVDDEGWRYTVASAYWSPMGWRLICIRLEM